MKIYRAYKVELDLNNVQRTACMRAAGVARFAYNWGLRRKIDTYQATGKSPSYFKLNSELNALKKTEYPWMYEVSKCAPQEALRDLDMAFKNFFRRVKLKSTGKLNGKVGFPRFKSRKNGIGSFRLRGAICVFDDRIQLPRLGKLRLKERGYIPTDDVKILSATVSERAGHWFVSVAVEVDMSEPIPAQGPPVGVDLGIKTMAFCSDGTVYSNPKALRKAQTKMRRLQRKLARQKKGSANREKTRHKIARLHYRISNVRRDALHKATSGIVAKTKSLLERPSVIVIEDLNVTGMMKNHKLARAIADVGMYEFKRQLMYKAAWAGSEILIADRWFPSSKTCSECGAVKATLSLSERVYNCEVCGASLDRDLNAARNLANLASTASSAGSHACGENVSPMVHRQISVKQEPNIKCGMSTFG